MKVLQSTPGRKLLAAAFFSVAAIAAAVAQSENSELPGFSYPYPLSEYTFTSQGMAMKMAYMDVKPEKPNGHAIVLLHGKNFCAATWEATIHALSQNGYRVIAPIKSGSANRRSPTAINIASSSLRRTRMLC